MVVGGAVWRGKQIYLQMEWLISEKLTQVRRGHESKWSQQIEVKVRRNSLITQDPGNFP